MELHFQRGMKELTVAVMVSPASLHQQLLRTEQQPCRRLELQTNLKQNHFCTTLLFSCANYSKLFLHLSSGRHLYLSHSFNLLLPFPPVLNEALIIWLSCLFALRCTNSRPAKRKPPGAETWHAANQTAKLPSCCFTFSSAALSLCASVFGSAFLWWKIGF